MILDSFNRRFKTISVGEFHHLSRSVGCKLMSLFTAKLNVEPFECLCCLSLIGVRCIHLFASYDLSVLCLERLSIPQSYKIVMLT